MCGSNTRVSVISTSLSLQNALHLSPASKTYHHPFEYSHPIDDNDSCIRFIIYGKINLLWATYTGGMLCNGIYIILLLWIDSTQVLLSIVSFENIWFYQPCEDLLFYGDTFNELCWIHITYMLSNNDI